jgi:hypothetical protein
LSLGRALIDELKRGVSGPVEVADGDVRATVDVEGSGPYGAELRGISIERTATVGVDVGEAMQRVVEGIAERVQYLPERVEALEVDAASGRGILRTRRDQVKDREYYEVAVDGGDRVEVGRFRGNSDGGRERIADNLSHRVIERLVDDLADVIAD